MPALQIYYSRDKVSLATACFRYSHQTVQETAYAHLRTIAYTFATNCFKYLNIAYCLCFKTNDRRRTQRAYAENIGSATAAPEYQSATQFAYAEDSYGVLFVFWAGMRHTHMHEPSEGAAGTLTGHLEDTSQLARARAPASVCAFCDLYIWLAV